MRVLHLLKTAEGATWAWRQMRTLQSLGVDVHVVLPRRGTMTAAYEAERIPVHQLDCDIGTTRSIVGFREASSGLRRLVRALGPDVVHSHFVGPALLARLALGKHQGPCRVFQVPGPLHLEHRISRGIDLVTAGRADFWIASCRKTRDLYLQSGIDPARVGLSFYGTDVDSLGTGQPGRLRGGLPIEDQGSLIGMVAYVYRPKRWLGRRRGIKGHEDLIDAVALLRQRGRQVTVVFAGGAWAGAERYYETITAYGRRVLGDHAVFLGTRNDVMDVYADLDVAVHPSHSENLGGAVESLLAGVPTVATNVGGLPDIVVPGKTGWLCQARSPTSLAAAIAEVLDGPAEASARALAGRALVVRELDVRRTAGQVLDFYRLALSRAG